MNAVSAQTNQGTSRNTTPNAVTDEELVNACNGFAVNYRSLGIGDLRSQIAQFIGCLDSSMEDLTNPKSFTAGNLREGAALHSGANFLLSSGGFGGRYKTNCEGRFWIELGGLVLSVRTPSQGTGQKNEYHVYLDRKNPSNPDALSEAAFLKVQASTDLNSCEIEKHRINNPGSSTKGDPTQPCNELKLVTALLMQASTALRNMRRADSEGLTMPPITA